MAQPRLTHQQKQAVELRGRSLLVSAAAGSGKTFVLVQRLMKDILQGADITEYLIITYTRAAATELRGKIQKELTRLLKEETGLERGRHLRRQLLLLPQASIGTIHSFCSNLLREHASALGISPNFKIMDEAEAAERKTRAMDAVLEKAYASIDENRGFRALADMMVQTRGDSDLKQALLSIYDNLRSLPNPEEWMRRQLDQAFMTDITDLYETPWGKALMRGTGRVVKAVKSQWQLVADTLRKEYKPGKWLTSLEALLVRLEELEQALERSWDEAARLMPLDYGSARLAKGEEAEGLKAIHNSCKELMKAEETLYSRNSASLLEDMRAVGPETAALYELVLAFEEAFRQEKAAAGKLDYSDLEHMSLKLLYNLDGDGMHLTAIAASLAGNYREVMVDEYQDVNQVQELLVQALSGPKGKCFMVGDMKQSIYRFRMADVSIFKEKYESYPLFDGEDGNSPVKVLLPVNFRSSKGVVDGVNAIFSPLMSEQVGDLSYGPQEELRFGRLCPEDQKPVAELVRIGEADAVEMKKEDSRLMEARAAAQKIQEMIDTQETVWDKRIVDGEEIDYQRPVSYEDFAILLRSTKDVEAIYQRALTEYGIPYCTLAGDPWFTSPEVELLLDLLSIVDNPRQDIPLIHVLQSPLFGFSYDLLARIRGSNKNAEFYDALLGYRSRNEQCEEFLTFLAGFRALAAHLTAEQILWRIMDATHAKALLGAAGMSGAEESNLNHLLEFASGFEADGYRGLFRFNRYVRFLQESGRAPVGAESSKGSGVQIMTIHKSKGLEFPVVLLCDTGHDFNQADSRNPVLFHKELGVGLYRRDRASMRQYPTMARKAIADSLRQEAVSEEMRVLYVALTRARDKLVGMIPPAYLRKNAKDCVDKTTEEVLAQPEWEANPLRVGKQNNYRAWILTAVLQNPRIREQLLHQGNTASYPWRISRLLPDEHPGRRQEKREAEDSQADSECVKAIRHRISRSYANEASTFLPAKVTATELKGALAREESAEEAEQLLTTGRTIRKPDFSGGTRTLTGSERGTAMHSAMQFLRYEDCHTPEGLERELQRGVSGELMTSAQAGAANR
ncbi:MAG: helicase-exonuclease AddAB subunit AddA, partial [Oscillospiraceae bacterium]|nr:helicase-exonuclease AddAB subunit AddA [Oscillospiraceae bacterium]